MKERCLVLGANGFIGSHLVDRLVAEGYCVTAFDRFSRPPQFVPSPCVRIVKGEFQDQKRIEEALEGVDYILHYLWSTYPALSVKRGDIYEAETNLLPSWRLLRLAAERGVGKIIFPSSSTVYNSGSLIPVSEEYPLAPQTPHAGAKVEMENLLGWFGQQFGLDYLVFRIGNAYGPRQSPLGGLGFINVTLGRIARGEKPVIFGDGSVVRDYIFIDDVVAANLLALKMATHSKVLNLGSGVGLSLNELLTKISQVLNQEIKGEYLPPRVADIPYVVLDIKRIQGELGFKPQVSLDVGIKLTWQWIKKTSGGH